MATKLITRVRRTAAALVVATPALLGGATPAGALATASVVDNGNGSITVTHAGAAAGLLGSNVLVALRDASLTCSTNFNPYLYILDANGETGAPLASSPAVVTAGTSAGPAGSPNPVPIAAGNYRVCVVVLDYANPANDSVVGDLLATIGNPTTPTTPTTPGNAPQVSPAYTG